MVVLRQVKFLILFFILGFIWFTISPVVQGQQPPELDELMIEPTEFGISFINSAEALRDDERIRDGVEAGAQLDRFPLYWDRIEASPGEFDWSKQDAALRANEQQGLGTLAILLGTASHYWAGSEFVPFSTQLPNVEEKLHKMLTKGEEAARSCPQEGIPPASGLYLPVFADGTDEPAADKTLNQENPWARFVGQAVERYRPGGTEGRHVRYWEIWNEADLCHFWRGTALDYARLLKVAYLTIKHIDPEATVLWGGLALYGPKYDGGANFLHEFVAALKNDPLAAAHNGFFDAPAVHQYSNVMHSYHNARRVQNALSDTGWEKKPIWVTESGVPICDAHPGPDCDVTTHRATPAEQAAYIWQNIAYTRIATWPNVGPIFHFQLYDDAGNECKSAGPADGFGLISNTPDSPCTPHTAEARLAYTAYQLATQYFSRTELLWNDIQEGLVRRVAFYHPETGERRTLVWALDGRGGMATLPAITESARLLTIDGSEETITPVDGVYQIPVPAATNQNQPNDLTYTIGGQPYLLIEGDFQLDLPTETEKPSQADIPIEEQAQADTAIEEPSQADIPIEEPSQADIPIEEPSQADTSIEEPSQADTPIEEEAMSLAEMLAQRPSRVVVPSEGDTQPPRGWVHALPSISNPSFTVKWEVIDAGSGLAPDSVTVWVYYRKDGVWQWEAWLTDQGATGSATFTGKLGKRYYFAALGADQAGNNGTSVGTFAHTLVREGVLVAQVSGYVQTVEEQPASWAHVTIGNQSATADEAGFFALEVPFGEWDVLVEGNTQRQALSFSNDTELRLILEPINSPVFNGSFENDLTYWQTGGSSPLAVEVRPNSQDHGLRLATEFVPDANVPGAGGLGTGGNSTISQPLIVPFGNPVLSLAYEVESGEADQRGNSCSDLQGILHDRFEIIVIPEDGTPDYIHCQEAVSSWGYRSFDLSQYAGQRITLIFNMYETSADDRTTALIDHILIGQSPVLPQPDTTGTSAPQGGGAGGIEETLIYYLPLMLTD